ncbi:MAG: NfeD family protein, partial [Melioribacteraceae bacterium]
TTVVDGTGEKQSEKYQSYMRSEMRATAEKNNRRTDIAQGMVDETIVVADLNDDEKKLITLTSEEAVKYKMADTVLAELADVEKLYGSENAELVTIESNWAEDLVRFLNHPVVSTLLILIGMFGIITEIKMGVWGVPGTVAVVALALFFGSGYLLDLASLLEIIIFILGVILLLLEIFVIPGFGIVGIIGILFMIAGLFFGLVSDFGMNDYSILSDAITQLAAVFVLSAIFIFVLSKLLPKSTLWNKLILQADISYRSGYAANQSFEHLVGADGVALTTLRPAGSAIINGQMIDVVTEGDYIDHDSKIVVKAVEGSKVVVGLKE